MAKRRVVFCTYSSVYSSVVLAELLKSDNIQLVGIINSTRVLNSDHGWLRGALEFMKMSGLRYAVQLFFLTDLFSLLQPISKLKPLSFHAKKLGIPVFNTRDINNEESVAFLHNLEPDFLLSGYFNQLIGESVLSLPALGCLNIHPSLLPAYRGVDPVFYALLRSEHQVGVTVHLLDQTFDTGNILGKEVCPVLKKRSLFFHYARLFQLGGAMAVKQMVDFIPGESGRLQQGVGGYDSWPSKSLIKKFSYQGYKLISFYDYISVLSCKNR